MKVMKVKNVEVKALMEFIMGFELNARDSRLRMRFIKMLNERVLMVDEENQQLILHFCEKDKDGQPVTVEKEGNTYYDLEPQRAKYNRELFLLLNEDYVIELNEERKDFMLLIKGLILECDMTFKNEEAIEYDRWCDIAEQIDYETEE